MIRTTDLTFEYIRRDAEGNPEGVTTAVDHLNVHVRPGAFVAVVGHNGSGKSTFARLLNALLFPSEGGVWVDGIDTSDAGRLLDVRMRAGMVFQNPDNQIIGQVVEEDVAFGPENMGVPTEEIRVRVDDALKTMGMEDRAKADPNRLSGGQKQRVSIAGVIAMRPKCIILDEPTAMLDPKGREEVLKAALHLNRDEKITVILITHHMDEVVHADHVFVMDKGRVVMEGSPREVFSHLDELEALRLTAPYPTLLGHALRREGMDIPPGILTEQELTEAIVEAAGV